MRLNTAVAVILASASPFAFAQSGKSWEKNYPVNGRPTLTVSDGSEGIHTTSCGGCRSVSIYVDAHDADLNDYAINESASGNSIHFELKRRNDWSWGGFHGRGPEIRIQTPAESDVSLKTGSGGADMSGIHGNLAVAAGSGGVRINDGGGHLDVSAGSGGIVADGRFTQFRMRTGSGSASLTLRSGEQLDGASSMASGSGGVHLAVPRDLRARVSAKTGSGGIHSDVPMMTSGNLGRGHLLNGTLNGGGPDLDLATGSGGVSITGI